MPRPRVVSPIPEELLEERAIKRLMQSDELVGSLDAARGALESLNEAQRIGVGNLGLSLEQVQNPNYTQHTPEALIVSIEGDVNFDSSFGKNTVINNGRINAFLNEVTPQRAMGRVRKINELIINTLVEGEEINYFDAVMQLSEEQQRRVAINGEFLEDVRAETNQSVYQQDAMGNVNQQSDSDTSEKQPKAASLSEEEKTNKEYYSPKTKNSFTEKEELRKRRESSTNSDDDKKLEADPNKKPRGR